MAVRQLIQWTGVAAGTIGVMGVLVAWVRREDHPDAVARGRVHLGEEEGAPASWLHDLVERGWA